MGHAFIHKPVNYPEDWHIFPGHEGLLNNINQLMSEHCDTIYGDVQLNIGELSMCWQAQDNRLRKTINMHVNQHQLDKLNDTLCPLSDLTHQHIYAQLAELPFAQGSIDAVCLCNGLDFTHDPHQLLREIERIVRSDGYLILTGFNPLSLSGMMHSLPFYRSHPLREARFFSHMRVKEWLHVLGFTVKVQRFFGPANVFTCQKTAKEYNGKDHQGKDYQGIDHQDKNQQRKLQQTQRLSPLNSCYFIVAQKTEMPMSIIKPRFTRFNPRMQSAQASLRVDTKQPAQD